MSSLHIEELNKLIASKSDIVNFGADKDAFDQTWVAKAEKALKRNLSKSYKWFLQNYAGGAIGGEEIYSLYGMDFESVNGGDIVYHHLIHSKSDSFDDSKLVVSETDLGEKFFFNYNLFNNEECPIFIQINEGYIEEYANDFYVFLIKRIEAHS